MKTIPFLILFCIPFIMSAQKHDKNWVMGAATIADTFKYFEIYKMIHYNESIEFDTIPMVGRYRLNSCSASYSDREGNLKYYSNGKAVYNVNGEIMQNGDSINYGFSWDVSSQSYPAANCIIPVPGDNEIDSISYLIHAKVELKLNNVYFVHLNKILCTRINLKANGGIGEVEEKDIQLANGVFESIAMTRHGNGVDWWIVTADIGVNVLRSYLFIDGKVHQEIVQEIGPVLFDSTENVVNAAGVLAFSHDGKYLARVNLHSGLWVYEFDRCTGLFTDVRSINFEEPLLLPGEGVAYDFEYSPSGQYLYFMTGGPSYQIDLWKDTLELVEMELVGEPKFKCHTSRQLMQLAPDGKIYIAPGSSSLCMHIIHYPDLPWPECQFIINDVELPVYNHGSLVHYPNYRLGELKGSPCDTVGGISSTETLSIPVSGFDLYPNPATHEVVLELNHWLQHDCSYKVTIWSTMGISAYNGVLPAWAYQHRIPVHALPPGLYIVELRNEHGSILGTKQLVVE